MGSVFTMRGTATRSTRHAGGPGGEVECGGICLHARLTFVWMEFLVSRSLKVEHGVQVQNAVLGLGQESVLVGCGGDQDLGYLNIRDVRDDGQGSAHVFEMVWRLCERWHEIDGRPWSDAR